jgi:hypothetical protein
MNLKRLWVLASIIALLTTACSSELSLEKTEFSSVDQDVQAFMDRARKTNGAFLYQADRKNYLLLNGVNVIQGDPATTFSNVEVKGDGDTLNIFYDEDFIQDSEDKKLANDLLYEVKLNKDYETIKLFKNGVESHFTNITIGGKEHE